MALEAVMICVDNSEYMRNGDFAPTRLLAQRQSVQYITDAKLQKNQETVVGFLSMAGHRIEVHASPGRNVGKIMNGLAKDVKPYGKCNFIGAMRTAQLALKKRVNQRQRQRIIMFVGSPMECEEKQLVKTGKLFKKNSIAVDVINFGTENAKNDNMKKLEAFIAAVNDANETSHLVNIPPGQSYLAGLILNTPIMTDVGGSVTTTTGSGGSAPSGGGGGGQPFPVEDQEFNRAILVSMEEERARQQKLLKEGENKSENKDDGKADSSAPADSEDMVDDDDEDDEDDDEDEEAMLLAAIAMSKAVAAADDEEPENKDSELVEDDVDLEAILKDEDGQGFLEDILDSVPGVNKDDFQLDDILNSLQQNDEEEDDDDTNKDKANVD